jgi:hypothetical protein
MSPDESSLGWYETFDPSAVPERLTGHVGAGGMGAPDRHPVACRLRGYGSSPAEADGVFTCKYSTPPMVVGMNQRRATIRAPPVLLVRPDHTEPVLSATCVQNAKAIEWPQASGVRACNPQSQLSAPSDRPPIAPPGLGTRIWRAR